MRLSLEVHIMNYDKHVLYGNIKRAMNISCNTICFQQNIVTYNRKNVEVSD